MICGGWLRGLLILHADISLPIRLSFATGLSSATISSLIRLSFATGLSSATISSLSAIRVPP